MSLAFYRALGVTAPPATAQSIVLDDNQNPAQVEQLGFSTSYHVEGYIQGRPNWVEWRIRQTDASPPQTSGTGSNNVFAFDIPGTFEITAKITYGSVRRPGDVAPPAQTVPKTVTIQPPALKIITYSRPSAPYAMAAQADDPQTSPNKIGDSEGQTVLLRLPIQRQDHRSIPRSEIPGEVVQAYAYSRTSKGP